MRLSVLFVSRRSVFAYASIVLLAFATRANASLTCQPYGRGLCAGIVPDFVLVPDGTSKEIMEAKFDSDMENLRRISYFDPVCYQKAFPYFCLETFEPCENGTSPIKYNQVCRSVCDEASDECAYLSTMYSLTFDCASLGNEDRSNCSIPASEETILPDCPDEHRLGRPSNGGRCERSCIFRYYNDSQEDILDSVSDQLSWISFAVSLLVILTHSIFPSKRAFPQSLVLYLGIASLGSSIGQLFGTLPTEDIRCIDDVTLADGSVPWCVAQGVFLHYFPLATGCWWLSIAINQFLFIYDKFDPAELHSKYHIFSWGLPALLTLIALVGKRYSYTYDGFHVCALETQELLDGLYIYWFMIIGIIGVCFIVGFFALISQQLFNNVDSNRLKRHISTQIRAFMFLGYYIIVVVCLISLTYESRYRRDEAISEVENYFKCLFAPVEFAPEQCSYKVVIPFSFTVFTKSMAFGQGVFVGLIYLTKKDTYLCYRNLILYRTVDFKRRTTMQFARDEWSKQRSTSMSTIRSISD